MYPYCETTENVKVSVLPRPLEEGSNPNSNVFAFSYQVKIENLSSEIVQLLERHWIITSGEIQMAEVVGPGVVGEQPVMEPGATFDYCSSTIINSPEGSMEGSYTFRSETGRFFQVRIPKFNLLYSPMYLIH